MNTKNVKNNYFQDVFNHKRFFFILFLVILVLLLLKSDATAKDIPVSVQMFYIGFDALQEANERPEGITPRENIARIIPLFQKVIDSGTKINRAELNLLYSGLGDNFLDGAVKHARLMIKVINKEDTDMINRALAAYVSWQRWWNKNKVKVTEILINRFG